MRPKVDDQNCVHCDDDDQEGSLNDTVAGRGPDHSCQRDADYGAGIPNDKSR